MDFTSEIEIRQQLARYLKRECTLNEFQDWFVPHSWNFHQSPNRALQKLVAAIELAIAEFTNGDWTDTELRSHFNSLLTTYAVDLVGPSEAEQPSKIVTESNSSLQELRLKYSWRPADIQFSVEYA
jgi:hypothetical protein